MKKDGDKWRRVVASPLPKQIFEIRPIKWLLQKGTVVIAAGGGGCDAASDTFMPATLADKRRRVTAVTTKKTGTSPIYHGIVQKTWCWLVLVVKT